MAQQTTERATRAEAAETGTIVRATASVMAALRRVAESRGYTEVVVPSLVSSRERPFAEPLEVHLGDGRAVERAQLAMGPGGYLEALMPDVGDVYTLAPAFRGERGPDWLIEFRYFQATAQGTIDDAVELATNLISEAAGAAKEAGVETSVDPKTTKPASVSYADAAEQLGVPEGQGFTQRHYLELAARHDDQPVVLTGVPLALEPTAALGSGEHDRGPAFFELVLPIVGEVGSGKQFAESAEAFRRSTDVGGETRTAAAANWQVRATWHDPESLEATAQLLSRLPSPTFQVSIGLERLVQFVLGADRITDAVAFPITTDGRSLGLDAHVTGLLGERGRLKGIVDRSNMLA